MRTKEAWHTLRVCTPFGDMYVFPVDTIWCSADAEHEDYVPLLQTCVRLSEAGQMQGVSICEYLCVFVHMHVHIHVHAHMHVFSMHLTICMCACMCACACIPHVPVL